jgi:hypothetical protein
MTPGDGRCTLAHPRAPSNACTERRSLGRIAASSDRRQASLSLVPSEEQSGHPAQRLTQRGARSEDFDSDALRVPVEVQDDRVEGVDRSRQLTSTEAGPWVVSSSENSAAIAAGSARSSAWAVLTPGTRAGPRSSPRRSARPARGLSPPCGRCHLQLRPRPPRVVQMRQGLDRGMCLAMYGRRAGSGTARCPDRCGPTATSRWAADVEHGHSGRSTVASMSLAVTRWWQCEHARYGIIGSPQARWTSVRSIMRPLCSSARWVLAHCIRPTITG